MVYVQYLHLLFAVKKSSRALTDNILHFWLTFLNICYPTLTSCTPTFCSSDIILLMCGPLGRVLAAEWNWLRPDMTFLEIGSLFDPTIGADLVNWGRKYELFHPGWNCMFIGDVGVGEINNTTNAVTANRTSRRLYPNHRRHNEERIRQWSS